MWILIRPFLDLDFSPKNKIPNSKDCLNADIPNMVSIVPIQGDNWLSCIPKISDLFVYLDMMSYSGLMARK